MVTRSASSSVPPGTSCFAFPVCPDVGEADQVRTYPVQEKNNLGAGRLTRMQICFLLQSCSSSATASLLSGSLPLSSSSLSTQSYPAGCNFQRVQVPTAFAGRAPSRLLRSASAVELYSMPEGRVRGGHRIHRDYEGKVRGGLAMRNWSCDFKPDNQPQLDISTQVSNWPHAWY